MSSTARPRFLWKATSVTPRALAAVRLSWLAYPPSAATCRGGTPQRAIWRSSIGRKRSASAGLPVSTTTSRIKPLWAGGQVELVSILHVTGTLDDDVGMRLEQTHQLLAGRHRLAVKDAPLALGEDALDQRQIVAELSAPACSRAPGEVGQPVAGLLQRHLGGPSSGNQLAI